MSPSTGTGAGLVDEQKSPSVFKHEVLRQYVPRFIAKTTMGMTPRRCVLFDGFAGAGRYLDGKAGSGEYLMIEAQKQKANVSTTVFAVEPKAGSFKRLDAVADGYRGRGLDIRSVRAECLDFLPIALNEAAGASLFLFIDPCGAAIPADVLIPALNGRPEWPPTEVLLNFSADLTRRAAGVVLKGDLNHPAVLSLNRVCGGTWWQAIALAEYEACGRKNWLTAANAVAREYASFIGTSTNRGWASVAVRRREHHQPIYHLIFLTSKPHGLWVMGDAIAKARHQWMRFVGPDEEEASEMLFGNVDQQITDEQTALQSVIAGNILTAIDTRGEPFKLSNQPSAVLGAKWGIALEKTVGAAARGLEKAGLITLTRGKNGTSDYLVTKA